MIATSDRQRLEAVVRQHPAEVTPRCQLADVLTEAGVYGAREARLYADAVSLVAGWGRDDAAGFRSERFLSNNRLYRVVPLAAFRERMEHPHVGGAGPVLVPCTMAATGACKHCLFRCKTRLQFVGPVLLRDPARGVWEPVLAVLTNAAWSRFGRQYAVTVAGDQYVGRTLSVRRQPRGKAWPLFLDVETETPRTFAEDVIAAAKGGAA